MPNKKRLSVYFFIPLNEDEDEDEDEAKETVSI